MCLFIRQVFSVVCLSVKKLLITTMLLQHIRILCPVCCHGDVQEGLVTFMLHIWKFWFASLMSGVARDKNQRYILIDEHFTVQPGTKQTPTGNKHIFCHTLTHSQLPNNSHRNVINQCFCLFGQFSVLLNQRMVSTLQREYFCFIFMNDARQ